jgi:hypothetical protein
MISFIKNSMKKTTILLLWLISWLLSPAQENSRESTIAALKHLSQTYLAAPYLSFDISYYYAPQAMPDNYLDSLHGSFKMNGGQYWYSLDSMETMTDTVNVVVLYKEDKIMYLSNSSGQERKGNPVALLDSLLSSNRQLHFSFSAAGVQDIITIYFPGITEYKSITYYIDHASGLLAKTVSLVKTAQMYEPDIRSQLNNANGYSIIETRFSNYQRNSFDAGVFNTARYYTKQNGSYSTTPAYSTYKIFLGKTGM